MTITRVGTNEKYAAGWELAFGKGKSAKKAGTTETSKKAAPAKKAAAKKVAKASAKTTTKAPAKKAATKKTATKKKG